MQPGIDLEPERAARNQSLSREVNERIHELSERLGIGVPQYLCECVDLSCEELIAVPQGEYRRVRLHRAEFIVVPGHERPHVEEVVDRDFDSRWVIVRKFGVGAKVAAELVSH